MPSTALPGHRSPGAGFEEPFEMLMACHERVERMLGLLQRLCEHLTHKGWDDSAAQAARDVLRYFDQAAPLHHQDEELHIFPALLAAPDAGGVHAVVNKLQQDHLHMVQQWAQARMVLQRINQLGDALWQPLSTDEATLLAHFGSLYQSHISAEEQLVYPAAQQQLSTAHLHAMGQDMMARRGVV